MATSRRREVIYSLLAPLLGAATALAAPPPVPTPSAATVLRLPASLPTSTSPLTKDERKKCVQFAVHKAFAGVIGNDRYGTVTLVPVDRRAGGSSPRTCKVELFDYAKSLDLQAIIDLASGAVISSRQLSGAQPAVGEDEVAAARSLAEKGAVATAANRPGVAITAMGRIDGGPCRRHRCVEVDYYQPGATAGTVPAAEPPGAKVPWSPVPRAAAAIIDLTTNSVVSTEVH